jgi:hypothetical protein
MRYIHVGCVADYVVASSSEGPGMVYGEDEKHLQILDEMLRAPVRFIEEITGVGTVVDRASFTSEDLISELRQQATKLGELARAAQIAADRIDEEFLKGVGAEDVRGAVLDEIRLVVENFPTGGYGSDPVPFPDED